MAGVSSTAMRCWHYTGGGFIVPVVGRILPVVGWILPVVGWILPLVNRITTRLELILPL